MTYYEKLKDPRWQKKRLEILERDGFCCRSCKNKDEELHIHHTVYERGLDPWEAESSTLVTLCKSCHAFTESLVKSCRVHSATSVGADLYLTINNFIERHPDKLKSLTTALHAVYQCPDVLPHVEGLAMVCAAREYELDNLKFAVAKKQTAAKG